ncbi:hypothetical protein HYU09_02155 [Candidatus Woesearchaeota archaeon]|nr:hypothetical protein [Candidatus Woesearchaeota archaeon]
MAKISCFLLVLVPIVFIYGCGNGEAAVTEDDTGKVTAYAYKVGEIEKKPQEENITTVRLCHDTDKGIIRWEQGKVFGYYDNASRFEFDDYCQNFNWLWEFYCEDEEPKQRHFLCRNGCEEGHCL